MLFTNENIVPESLPQLAESEERGLEKNYLKVQLIGLGIFLAILLVPAIVLIFVEKVPAWANILIFAVWFLITGLSVMLTVLGFPRKKISLREKDLSYRSGLLFRSVQSVPFARVQHCEVSQGPIARIFGLASLKVYTAGGSGSDLNVPGLLPEKAHQIKDFILQQLPDHA
ncbi:MAG: PH domain-containing protein [Bacteroidota bacterium]